MNELDEVPEEMVDVFLDIFLNEYVEIVQDYEVTTSVALTQEGDMREVRMPMTVNGIVMDSDGVFVFLSKDGQQVDQAIPMNSIKYIGIVELEDPAQDLLDSIEVPKKKDFN